MTWYIAAALGAVGGVWAAIIFEGFRQLRRARRRYGDRPVDKNGER